MILDKIIKHKRDEIDRRSIEVPLESFKGSLSKSSRNFKQALSEKFGIIAEIKRKSPSESEINLNVDVTKVAKHYSKNASAISVLTDEHFFGGSFENLTLAKDNSNLPVLCKDFIISEYQIYEARHFGADAILLIASVLSEDQICTFLNISKSLGMDSLVEIHNDEELNKVLSTPADIIGINNRDLKTFKIDLNTTLTLTKRIPDSIIKVSESGIKSQVDMQTVKPHVNAVLIGTSIMKSDNIEAKFKELLS